MVMTMANEHTCLHEEQIQNQSRIIERLGAELDYKKEKLDEIKENNRRMETKIDKINENLNDFISTSDSKDTKLDLRLTKIETRQTVLDETTTNNREEVKQWLAIITIIFGAITIYFNYFH